MDLLATISMVSSPLPHWPADSPFQTDSLDDVGGLISRIVTDNQFDLTITNFRLGEGSGDQPVIRHRGSKPGGQILLDTESLFQPPSGPRSRPSPIPCG
jgi:hypothetical protein